MSDKDPQIKYLNSMTLPNYIARVIIVSDMKHTFLVQCVLRMKLEKKEVEGILANKCGHVN